MKFAITELLMVYLPNDDSFLTLEVSEIAIQLTNARKIMEMGCGTGFIGINLARKFNLDKVVFVDIDKEAIDYTKQACEKEKIKNAEFIQSNLFEKINEKFDLIIFNAPYLPGKENYADLIAGEEGNEILYRFLKDLPNFSKSAVITYSSLSNFVLPSCFSEIVTISKKFDFESIYSSFIEFTSR